MTGSRPIPEPPPVITTTCSSKKGNLFRLLRFHVDVAFCDLCQFFICCRLFLESFLHGVSTRDVWTLVSVPIILVVAALAACAIPARRAMRVNPTVALRME